MLKCKMTHIEKKKHKKQPYKIFKAFLNSLKKNNNVENYKN